VSSFLAPQANNGVLSSHPVNSFAAPDVISTTATVLQPTFNLNANQSQSSSTSTPFPVANHGAFQPIGFGLAVTSSTNPVFAFDGQSSVGATPDIFAAVTTAAPVAAQNSFAVRLSGLVQNNQNAPTFGFQSPVIPSPFSFGKFMSLCLSIQISILLIIYMFGCLCRATVTQS